MKILSRCSIVAILSLCGLAGLGWLTPSVPGLHAAEGPVSAGPPPESAISAVFTANGGKAPATGEELWRALCKVGTFAQLPVPFSSVRLSSGLYAPRVVIAPRVSEVNPAEVTAPNLVGRLYLAANMEWAEAGKDARVTSVEFISWNVGRRRFDFGVIENMGGPEGPQLRMVDGGKCFTCHKNRGPILGVRPWSNSTNDDILRFSVASTLRVVGTALPQTGPFVLPKGAALRERVDGMALALPEAPEVDPSVRLGAALATRRASFRLLARTPEGRKALLALLTILTEKAPLEVANRAANHRVDDLFPASLKTFGRFATEWVDLQKGAKSSMLADIDPTVLLIASGARLYYDSKGRAVPGAVGPSGKVSFPDAGAAGTVTVPGVVNGNGSTWSAPPPRFVPGVVATPLPMSVAEPREITLFRGTLYELARYETQRATGSPGLISRVQPSNPRAFITPLVTPPARLSDAVNPLMLAHAIGLTDGDRRFIAKALEASVKKVGKPGVTPTTLAKEVFEGPQFAELLSGGPLPEREEFKDRFVEGLDEVLKKRHHLRIGFEVDRREYASGPKYDPAAVEEREVAVVPTTACLRCHEVGAVAKGVRFDLIPPLAFDPFDTQGRAAWLRANNAKQKKHMLARMLQRLATDADMPPEDAPEHSFREKDAAAFNEAKQFLQTELDKIK